MNEELRSILPGTAVLGVAGVIALFLTLTRGWAEESGTHLRGAVRIAVAAILFQAAHFSEELLAGFHERLPALFGLAPIPLRVFVWFNIAWLAIWGLSAWGVTLRLRVALFPLWFLGIASIANVVGHPALSVLAGGYFPGLVTSPLVGLLGGLLLHRLLLVTRAVHSSPGAT